MDEMVPADGDSVSIAHHHNDPEVGSRELDARREGQGSSMSGMHRVEVQNDISLRLTSKRIHDSLRQYLHRSEAVNS
jgi:hypothetical protein